MKERSIYKDIESRTGGDIYIGVVGPVRTGKSTFIKRFMDTLVLPHIADDNLRERATDELPQSSAGRTIMTTEPKFVPENAVPITLEDNALVADIKRALKLIRGIASVRTASISDDNTITPALRRSINKARREYAKGETIKCSTPEEMQRFFDSL